MLSSVALEATIMYNIFTIARQKHNNLRSYQNQNTIRDNAYT
jgi:hypothetical protein